MILSFNELSLKRLPAITTLIAFLLVLPLAAQRYMEKLDRGLIAVKSGSGYYLSWRLFGTDPQDNTFGFNVYKGATKLNAAVLTSATCYQDNTAGTGTYTIRSVTNGTEEEVSENAIVIDNGSYITIPLTPPGNNTANDCSTGDLDGDGQYEIVLKWDAVNSQDNANPGTTDNVYLDGYKLSGTRLWRIDLGANIRAGAHYTQFLVYDFDGDGMAEIACKTAPGTKDGAGNYLKLGPAAGANNTVKYANSSGYILSGPEWYTIFSGKTGAELSTVNYKPPRSGSLTPTPAQIDAEWGDDYGNRVDRFLAGVAYLDGQRPSLVPCRGYYTRSTLWALDWRSGKLTERWYFDTDSSGAGKDGKANSTYTGQGCHSLRQGDVDGDGFDEILFGACTIDHDGKGLYNTRLGHGDALHLSDLDPGRPGLEVWQVHESAATNGGIAASFRDAKTGAIIWSDAGSGDNGRGCTGPMVAGVKGWQMWSGAGGLWNVSHASAGSKPGSTNFTLWWGADLTRSLEDGTAITPGLTTSGMASNNGTKSTPCLTADILGDWREELILRTGSNNALHIYTTTTPTTYRLYTLMHDPVYRMSVATENVAYNQPPEPGIYIGPGMTLPQVQPDLRYYPSVAGVKPGTAVSGSVQAKGPSPMKVLTNQSFAVGGSPSGKGRTLAVYDLSGKLVHTATVNSGAVSLRKEFGLSDGLYIVYVKDLPVEAER